MQKNGLNEHEKRITLSNFGKIILSYTEALKVCAKKYFQVERFV